MSNNKLDFLHVFINILEELEIDYWLEGGTALAAYRDGTILPWEHDFDVGVLKEDLEKKINEFIVKINNIDCEYSIQKNYPFLDNIIQLYSNNKQCNPNQIDIYLYTLKGDSIYMRWFNSPIGFGSSVINNLMFLSNKIIKKNSLNKNYFKKILINFPIILFYLCFYINFYFYKSRYHCFPYYFFSKKKKINFCNLNLKIPYEIEKFLEYRYGKNWKQPDKNFNQAGKWKHSKARPILSQKHIQLPEINFNYYEI